MNFRFLTCNLSCHDICSGLRCRALFKSLNSNSTHHLADLCIHLYFCHVFPCSLIIMKENMLLKPKYKKSTACLIFCFLLEFNFHLQNWLSVIFQNKVKTSEHNGPYSNRGLEQLLRHLHFDGGLDLIKFWLHSSVVCQFSALSRVAVGILSVPASSALMKGHSVSVETH